MKIEAILLDFLETWTMGHMRQLAHGRHQTQASYQVLVFRQQPETWTPNSRLSSFAISSTSSASTATTPARGPRLGTLQSQLSPCSHVKTKEKWKTHGKQGQLAEALKKSAGEFGFSAREATEHCFLPHLQTWFPYFPRTFTDSEWEGGGLRRCTDIPT